MTRNKQTAEQESMKHLTPEERKAVRKQKKREAYKAERAERKLTMKETKWQHTWRKHKKIVIAVAALLVVAICGTSFYFMNRGMFDETSYSFVNYDKYIKLGSTDKLTYDEGSLKVTDKDVRAEIDSRVEAVGAQYNTDFIKDDTNKKYDNKKDYENFIREQLESEARTTAEDSVLDSYAEKCKLVSVPKKQLAYEKKQVEKQYASLAQMYGLDTSSDQPVYELFGMTKKEYTKSLKTYAEENVKQKMLVYSYAKSNGISATASDMKAYINDQKKDLGMTEKDFEKSYGMSFSDYIKENDGKYLCLRSLVSEALFKTAKENFEAKGNGSSDDKGDKKQ